jgi:hypothetical protein
MIKPQDSLAMIMNPKKPEQRLLAVVLALASVIGLAYASVSRQWMYNPASELGEYGFGLLRNYRCNDRAECETMSNGALAEKWRALDEDAAEKVARLVKAGAPETEISDAERFQKIFAAEHRTSAAFAICGYLAFIGCVIAGLSIAIALALVALKRRPHLPIMPTTTAILGIMLAIVTGCVFVATKPGSSGFVGVSFGFWGYAAGCILGIGSTLMLNRSLRPIDDELAEPMNPEQF